MVSPGCTNCYAMRMAARLQAMKHASYDGTTRKSGSRYLWTGNVNLIEEALPVPLHWKKSRRIFVNSMSDLFQDNVTEDFVASVWKTMELAHWHTFQILTKRPGRMARILGKSRFRLLPNVWLGASVESERFIGRINALRTTPAAIRFVSFEPLLASVGKPVLDGIDWAIVGGESGPQARPMRQEWVEAIKAACSRHGTAFFFKQWGGKNKKATGRLLGGRTWDEYPACNSVHA